jgi:hypothetical protein
MANRVPWPVAAVGAAAFSVLTEILLKKVITSIPEAETFEDVQLLIFLLVMGYMAQRLEGIASGHKHPRPFSFLKYSVMAALTAAVLAMGIDKLIGLSFL